MGEEYDKWILIKKYFSDIYNQKKVDMRDK